MSCPYAARSSLACPFIARSKDDGKGSASPAVGTEQLESTKGALKQIPQPPEHLYGMLGNIPDVDPEFLARSLWQLQDIYGPIYRLNLLTRKMIVIGNYEMAKDWADDDRFEKYTGGSLSVVANGLGDGLFTAPGHSINWAKAHRLLMPIFGPMGVRKMLPEMLDIAQQMVMGWDRLGPDNEIDAAVDFTKLAFDTIGLCGYGYRFNEFLNGLHPFAVQMADFLKESGRISSRTALETQMRVFSARKYQQNIDYMLNLVGQIIEHRQAHPQPDRHDLLNTMLTASDPVTGEKLDIENIKYNMVTFLVAGHETTSGTLSFLFYFLLKNPDTLMKAQKEVDEVLGDNALELKHLSSFKYIEACIRETLRSNGPITQTVRVAKERTVIGGCYEVEAGEAVNCNIQGLHHDPAVWGDDADEFKPERMLNTDKIPTGAWKPFGTGARSCIGRTFAEQEMVAATALILQRFQPEMADPQYNLSLKATMTIKPDNFKFKVRRRPGKGMMVGFAGGAPSTGLADHEESHVSSKAPKDASKHIEVLYGSNAGTCKSFAEEFSESAASHGYTVDIKSLDAATEHINTTSPTVIITSSYEGKPPDNAKKFVSWLESNKSQSSMLKDCRFAVFGVGNVEWAQTYQRVPKLVDELMEAEGASKLCESGFANVKENAIGVWEDWMDRFWNSVSSQGAKPATTSNLSVKIIPSKAAGILTGEETTYGTVLSNRILADNSVGPAKKCMDIELPEGSTYRSGDYLVVLPLNPLPLVQRILKYFKLDDGDVIEMSGTKKSFLHCDPTTTAYNLFSSRVELSNTVTQRQLGAIAETAEKSEEKEALQSIKSDETRYKSECLDKHLSIIDVLEDYPSCRLELAQFIDMLKPLSPRQYSISSSPLHEPIHIETHAQPVTASITYDVHEAPAWSGHNRTYYGVASSYLGGLTPGMRIRCFVRSTNAAFHLPADPKVPIIMMAAGTGLAPMRGFIQERAAIAQGRGSEILGPALLYFGCRDHEKDYIHKDELQTWEKAGIVSVRPTFSRQGPTTSSDNSTFKYVPDRVWAERDEIADLFGQGAKIFVCGSASKLAKSNADACRRIWLERNSGKSEKEAVEWLERIKEDRYVSDVFE